MKYIQRSVELPLEKIQQWKDSNGKAVNLSRAGLFADEAYIESLAADMKRNGQIEPCCVTKCGDEYHLITGNNRYQAAKIAGLKALVVNIVEGNQSELISLSISENLTKPLSPIDYAVAFARLKAPPQLGGGGLKESTIAARHNVSLGTVRNYLALLELPPDWQVLVHESDQNTGRFAKETDHNKLRPTKALQIYREVRKHYPDDEVERVLREVKENWEKTGIWAFTKPQAEDVDSETDTDTASTTSATDTGTASTNSASAGTTNTPKTSSDNTGTTNTPKTPHKKEYGDIGLALSIVSGIRDDLVAAFGPSNAASAIFEAFSVLLRSLSRTDVSDSMVIELLEAALSREALALAKSDRVVRSAS